MPQRERRGDNLFQGVGGRWKVIGTKVAAKQVGRNCAQLAVETDIDTDADFLAHS